MKKIAMSNYNTLIFFIMRSYFLGISATNIYRLAKQDGWISILVSTIFGFIPLFMYYYITKKYPSKNIFQISEKVFGKKIGTLINITINIFVFFTMTIILYNFVNFISSQYLYKTPDTAIAIMFFICFFYIAKKGINTLAKLSTIIFYIFAFFVTASILGLLKQINLSYILPTFEYGIFPIIKSSFSFFTINLLFIFLTLLIPYDQIDHKEKLLKNLIATYLLVNITIFIVVFFVLTIFGSNVAIVAQYPAFHLLKRLSLIGFIERIENIFSLQWIFDEIIMITFCLIFIREYIHHLFKSNFIRKNYIAEIITLILLLFSSNNIFKSITQANNFYLLTLPYINFIILFGIPLLILLIPKIKKNYADA